MRKTKQTSKTNGISAGYIDVSVFVCGLRVVVFVLNGRAAIVYLLFACDPNNVVESACNMQHMIMVILFDEFRNICLAAR